MCTVSMVMDHQIGIWPQRRPEIFPPDQMQSWPVMPAVTREEFDTLRREVEDLRSLLIRAKEYDRRNNEPDCEVDEKMAILKKVAGALGIDVADVVAKEGSGHAAQTA